MTQSFRLLCSRQPMLLTLWRQVTYSSDYNACFVSWQGITRTSWQWWDVSTWSESDIQSTLHVNFSYLFRRPGWMTISACLNSLGRKSQWTNIPLFTKGKASVQNVQKRRCQVRAGYVVSGSSKTLKPSLIWCYIPSLISGHFARMNTHWMFTVPAGRPVSPTWQSTV